MFKASISLFNDVNRAVRMCENCELLSVPFRIFVVPQNIVGKGIYEICTSKVRALGTRAVALFPSCSEANSGRRREL